MLPGLPDEKKRLDACKELPRLERLAKEERKIWSDPREPVLEQRAKQLGVSEWLSHSTKSIAAMHYREHCCHAGRAVIDMVITPCAGWPYLAFPAHLPPHLQPFEEKVEAELLEYGKRHRVLCDLERKVNLLKYDLKELKAEGNLIRAGKDQWCICTPKSGGDWQIATSRLACR